LICGELLRFSKKNLIISPFQLPKNNTLLFQTKIPRH
jgi:hypothetical protein